MDSMTVIYFVPVESELLSKWEYYQVDLEILQGLFQEVIVCKNLLDVVKNIHRAELIYSWWWHQSCPVVLLGKLFRKYTITTGAIHMYDLSGADDFYKKKLAYRIAARLSLAFSDANFFISKDQLRQITSHLYTKNPRLVVSSMNSQDTQELSCVLEKKRLIRDFSKKLSDYKFVSVVWHTEAQYQRKGVYEILDALHLLKSKTNHTFEWVIVGAQGNGYTKLQQRIVALQLEKCVKLRPTVSVSEKNELFLSSDLYLQPSWHEGFGNAVLEAMSCGLPALVSRYTAQPEVVGSGGLIAMEIDAENIYQKLIQFIAFLPEERVELLERMIGHIEKLYTFDRRLKDFKNYCIDLFGPSEDFSTCQ